MSINDEIFNKAFIDELEKVSKSHSKKTLSDLGMRLGIKKGQKPRSILPTQTDKRNNKE